MAHLQKARDYLRPPQGPFVATGLDPIASVPETGIPPIKIGSRGSPLALTQTHELRRILASAHGVDEASFPIHIIKTTGDVIQDRSLAAAGGKGLFTKELDAALLAGAIDCAVHSAKDLPTILPDGITILGYLPREDIRDAWISPKAPDPMSLPKGAVVGTASPRRAAMVKRLRPDLNVTLLRGNVETRLDKVRRGDVDATLLALAGLKRLGLADRATSILDSEDFVPAAGQGAIAVTARQGDTQLAAAFAPILDPATEAALRCERALLRILDGSCRTPIGGLAQLQGGEISLHAIILRPDGSQFFEVRRHGRPSEAEAVGEAAAQALLAQAPKGFFDA